MSKFIFITSCEEKQGKTILALELAKQLAENKSVLFIDISKSSNNSSVYMGYQENIIYDYVDLIDELCSLEEAVISAEWEGRFFDFIPSPRIETKESENLKIFGKLFMLANGKYDYIIIDGFSLYNNNKFLDYSVLDKIILMTESRIEDLKKVSACLNILGKENLANVSYIINKHQKSLSEKGTMFTSEEMQEMISIKMLGCIALNEEYDIKIIAEKIIEKL
jgi:septum site-determining protein MinD